MLPILINFLLAIHVLVCGLLVFVVLMQRPRSEGLGAAFGGGMTESMFGAQTSNVLAKFTVWLGGAFFALTLLLAILYAKRSSNERDSAIQQDLLNVPVPAAEVAPAFPEGATIVPAPENAGAAPNAETVPAPAPTESSVETAAPATLGTPVENASPEPTPAP